MTRFGVSVLLYLQLTPTLALLCQVKSISQLKCLTLDQCRERIDYQLDNAGIRVISGINLDDDGSLSNGAGKSALVMSALWALTGRTDPRAEVIFQTSVL